MSEEKRGFKYLDLVMVVFVTVLIVSNIASSAKIVDLGINLAGIRLAFDGGTLLFPISYVFGDILTEVYGFRRSRKVIWYGFGMLAFSALILWIVKILPGEATWQTYAGQGAYDTILGGMVTGGIVVASLVAYLVGELANSMVLSKMKLATKGKFLWLRTIGSTLVGQLLDSVLFIVVASIFGVFPWSLFLTLVLTNYLLKVFIEVVMTPLTYFVVNRLKKAEQTDHFDYGETYSPV